jgi:AcrR family transcriptional regulator
MNGLFIHSITATELPRTEQVNQEIRKETTEKILEAAQKVFARKGSTATMAEVAAEAGVSQGLAYRYFPSKEAILTTLVKQAAGSKGPVARIQTNLWELRWRKARIVSGLVFG